jgi:hypothetical protein
MNIRKLIYLVIFAITLNVAQAGTEYWSTIKQLIITHDEAKLSVYLKTLTPEELILAARECSREIQQQMANIEDWDMIAGAHLSFFNEYYPTKTNNLQDISVLLNDLQDDSQSELWRRYIMHKLGGSWLSYLSVDQCLNASNIMEDIIVNDPNSETLTPKAIRKSTNLLMRACKTNLLEDSCVKEYMNSTRLDSKRTVIAAQKGQIVLSDKTDKMNKKILTKAHDLIDEQVVLLSNRTTPTTSKAEIIVAWRKFHEYYLDTITVKQELAKAVDDYMQHDEKIWHLLFKTNIEDFNNPNAMIKLQGSINNAQDDTVKRHLMRLNKKLNKNSPTQPHRKIRVSGTFFLRHGKYYTTAKRIWEQW